MTGVVAIPRSAARIKPACIAKVRVDRLSAAEIMARQARTAERGLGIDQCGADAVFTICGRPFCKAHAGQRALEILQS